MDESWYEPEHGVRHDPTLPDVMRQSIIRRYAHAYPQHKVFVETGTLAGDTTNAMISEFNVLHTIELYAPLHAAATKRFANEKRVTCHLGDSADWLPRILTELDESLAIFWLDGHYSGPGTGQANVDSPVAYEIEAILATGVPHVVLIDDARLFGAKTPYTGYPTLEWVRDIATTQERQFEFAYGDDIIRIVPAWSWLTESGYDAKAPVDARRTQRR